jgi:transmembrane sensor
MNDLIARVLSGEATGSETQALEAWRRESPANEHAYQEFLHTWELTALHDARPPIPSPPAVATIVAQAEYRRGRAIPLVPRTARRRVWRWVAAAAVVTGTVVGGARVLRPSPARTIAAGPHETRTVVLADGSIVRLGAGSRLRVADSSERTLSLDGVAFFAVVPDSTRPFTVWAGAARAEALGTRFEVRADAHVLRLVVVEGHVRFSAHGRQVIARAGEESQVRGWGGPSAPEETDVSALGDWPHGLLIFQATPLGDALREVGAAFGTPVVIRDTTLAALKVTAWFDEEPMAEVVGAICQVAGARCVVGDTIEVAR